MTEPTSDAIARLSEAIERLSDERLQMAQTLAEATGIDVAAVEASIRAVQANPPTPEQMAERALLMRLNGKFQGAYLVPRHLVKRRVKR